MSRCSCLRLCVATAWLGFSLLFAQAPQVDSVTPGQLPIAGGAEVTVRGANLADAQLTLDAIKVAASSTSAREIRFTAPAHDNGYGILRIITAGGTAVSRLFYVPPALKDLPPGYITTVAGVGRYLGEFGPAREASLDPGGLVYGPDGSLYIAQAGRARIFRVRPDGILEPFAGSGLMGSGTSPGDGGSALLLNLNFPRTMLAESNGDLVFDDGGANRIWRVQASTGIARLIAGTGEAGFSGDGGPAVNAKLREPAHLASDGKGTIWFIDSGNNRIRSISPDGTIATICGVGTAGFSGDGGAAIAAQIDIRFGDQGGLAYDPAGLLYVADYWNKRIRRIDLATGIITTFVGPERNFGANLLQIPSVFLGPAGDLYFGATHQILHVTRDGQVLERFGRITNTGITPGPPTFDGTPIDQAVIGNPLSLTLDPEGNLVYADVRIMRMNRRTGQLETIAGLGPYALGENGPALAAAPIEKIPGPFPDLAVLPTGELLFSGNRIRKIGLDGKLSAVVGSGFNGIAFEDGVNALDFHGPVLGFELDPIGNLYFSDYGGIMQVDPKGAVRRFTKGACGFSGDGGPAVNAALCQPWDVTADREGNVFIADTNNNRIRRVDAKTGIITTVAGSGPVNGFENYFRGGSYCGDGGPAIQACINTPFSVAVNSQGELYIVEGPNRIRKVDRNGIISTLGTFSIGWDAFMALDSSDNVYLKMASQVARITPGGSVQVLAGRRQAGFSGDGGPARDALLDSVSGGVGFDAEGNLYFVDGQNRRIRAVRFGAVLAPANSRAQIAGGTPQTAPIGTRFANSLAVLVSEADGTPAVNVRVDFSTPGSGPSCVLSTPFALTGRNGKAEVSCTANTIPGAFSVSAVPVGLTTTVRFALTNAAPQLSSNSVVNGASFLSGPIAPGEIVSIFGAGMGPLQLAQASPGAGQRFSTQLAGVRARFNDVEAPLIFARSDVLGAVVPYALEGSTSAQVTVEYAGVVSNRITVPVAQSSPAVFSIAANGRGQGAVLNENSSVNSAENAAEAGSIIVLFCTGEGQTNPPGVDGLLAIDVYPKPKLPVAVTIGGKAAEIVYAGAAPGLVAGVLQINARVPLETAPGAAVPVTVKAGDAGSPQGITIAVR